MSRSLEMAFQKAFAALQNGQLDEAERGFKKVLAADPRNVAALNLYTVVLIQLRRFAEAERFARRALREYAGSDVTFYNLGVALLSLGRPGEAVEEFTRALALKDTVAETWSSRGAALNQLGRFEEAAADCDRAIALDPTCAAAFATKGRVLAERQDYEHALQDFERALALRPDLAEAWTGSGNVLLLLDRRDEALAAYDRALAAKPQLAEAWLGRGTALFLLRRNAQALPAFEKALELEPGMECAAGFRLLAKLNLCDWSNLERDCSALLAAVKAGRKVCRPYVLLNLPTDPALQLQCARLFAASQPTFAPLWQGERFAHERIRVGYLSGDLREHAIGYLTVGLFEQHDRDRFEITAYSYGPRQESETSRRIQAAVDRFVDVRARSDQDIAAQIRADEIDIAVDLMGYTGNSRPQILARRPAAVQINYLGYPGTMGLDYLDYLIADRTIVPDEHRAFYSEHVVRLPHSYQANDDRRRISDRPVTRAACGLPDTAVVLCCFNAVQKIHPAVFEVWMRVLRALDDAVLWLFVPDADAAANLRRAAETHGVAPGRLVFAPPLPLADHLARHRLADLALDTLPYNAHTTASDALWAGLPMVTCLGSTFAGRVGAGLLRAAGLPELVTENLADYEALILQLGRERSRLATLRARLADNLKVCPLFDTRGFARSIEAAYAIMADRSRRGLPPESFDVALPQTEGC